MPPTRYKHASRLLAVPQLGSAIPEADLRPHSGKQEDTLFRRTLKPRATSRQTRRRRTSFLCLSMAIVIALAMLAVYWPTSPSYTKAPFLIIEGVLLLLGFYFMVDH